MAFFPRTTRFRRSSSAFLLQRRSFTDQLSSFTSTSPSSLLSHLRSHLSSNQNTQQEQLPVILYSLPTSLPSSSLPSFLSLLQESASSSIGLLSSPIPAPSSSSTSSSLSHIISFALLNPATTKVFRSESKGRNKVTVGRWRPLNESAASVDSSASSSSREVELANAFEGGDWSSMWDPPRQDQQRSGSSTLSGEESVRSRLKGLGDVENAAIDSLIVLSTPAAASSLLQDLFFLAPDSNRLGLITPPTPFVNGRPFTLYLNESVFEDGAVGLALLRSSSSSVLSVEWEGMELLSPLVCEVKEAQGNLLLGINVIDDTATVTTPLRTPSSSSSSNSNPTQHLISLLASSPSPSLANSAIGKAWLGGKEKEFFLGFLTDGGKVDRVKKILSGDPKRGGMALDSEESLREGEKFIFLHHSSSAFDASTSSPSSPSSAKVGCRLFAFSTVPEASLPPIATTKDSSEVVVQEGVFQSGSEKGFLFGERGTEGSVDGGVPGGSVRLLTV